MPSFGMYTAEGTLVSWRKPTGATVEAGEVVLEIETEKAVQEVGAPVDGVLHHVLAEGAQLQVETLIGYVLAPGEAPPVAGKGSTPPPSLGMGPPRGACRGLPLLRTKRARAFPLARYAPARSPGESRVSMTSTSRRSKGRDPADGSSSPMCAPLLTREADRPRRR